MGQLAGVGWLSPHEVAANRDYITRALADELVALMYLLERNRFNTSGRRFISLELELALTKAGQLWHHGNELIIALFNDDAVTPELGGFQIEFALPHTSLDTPGALERLRGALRHRLLSLNAMLAQHGAQALLIGTPPGATQSDIALEQLTPELRYLLLNHSVWHDGARIGFSNDIFSEPLFKIDSIGIEMLASSIQPHLQPLSLDEFVRMHNRGVAFMTILMIVGANAPFVLEHDFWADSRGDLFQLATRGRAPYNGRYIRHPYELFHWMTGNDRHQPDILIPLDVLSVGNTSLALAGHCNPRFDVIKLLNGAHWPIGLRPSIVTEEGNLSLNWEVRAISTQPTIDGILAMAGLAFAGLLSPYMDHVVEHLPSREATDNWRAARQYGLDARILWPDKRGRLREVDGCELVIRIWRHLASALRAAGFTRDEVKFVADIVLTRMRNRQNGASWQRASASRFQQTGLDRLPSLLAMREAYQHHSQNGLSPVDVGSWPLAG